MNGSRHATFVVGVCLLSLAMVFATPAAARSKPKHKAKATPTTVTTVNAAATAADKAAATAALLQLADLQPGDPNHGFRNWSGALPQCSQAGTPIPCPTPPIPSGSSDVLRLGNPDTAFAPCATSVQVETANSKYRTDAADYFTNVASSLGTSIYVFPTVQQAKDYLATYAQPAAKECFQHGIGSQADPSEVTPEYPEFDANTVPPGSFDDGVGYDAVFHPVPDSSAPGSHNFQDIRYRTGRAVIFLSSYNDNFPNPAIAFLPGTANYLLTIRDRLNQQLPN